MRRVIVTFAGVAPLLFLLLLPRSFAAALGVLMLSHALILYPTLRPNVQWLGPVVTYFDTNANEVWLTIDDGPTDDTLALLDALQAREVVATFFVKGTLAAARPDLIRTIVDRGHTIGNHSHTHPSAAFWCLPPERIAHEIDACAETIPPTTLFRAPVGMKNPFVHPHLARRGMKLIGWSVRGFDATRDAEEKVVARIVPRVAPGAIVVMHQGRPWSVRTIVRVVDELRARGFTFVTPASGRLDGRPPAAPR
jgi:peptidoglycan/xylan/chitin deacetylase (PgdA/CDA1 family)